MDERVAALLHEVGAPADGVDQVDVVGHDPVLPTAFPVGEAAATAVAAVAATAAGLWARRTGERQSVRVDVDRAAASLIGFAFQSVDGRAPDRPAAANPLVSMHRCRDGRWLHVHGGFPRLAAGTAEVLGIAADATGADVADAVARWDGPDLEDALAGAGQCGAMVRTTDEWDAHPQSEALAPLGRVEVSRVGDAPPEPVGDGIRPLGGVRVLDLTRVLAGPTHGRTLAEHGADVLLVNGPQVPNIEPFVWDTGHGKRSTFLDLTDAGDAARLRDLVATADVFTDGYRPGALARHGLGVDDLARLRPGIVVTSISCYGDAGPWRERPGWEQLAQSVSGIAAVHGTPDEPVLMPAAACDYTTGYLAALGTMVALARRAEEGGSWLVRASLCQTARWFTDLGPTADPGEASGLAGASDWLVETDTPYGPLRHLPPVAAMSATPPRWERPTVPLGTDPPTWG